MASSDGHGAGSRGAGSRGGRDETSTERADRKFDDILQELRVMQTGVQLVAGFLLTLPFQGPFRDLDDVQRGTYLGLVLLAGGTTVLVLSPIALHRRLSGRLVKEQLVAIAHRLATAAIVCVALLVVAITWFIFDVVTSRAIAAGAAVGMAVVATALLALLPGRAVAS